VNYNFNFNLNPKGNYLYYEQELDRIINKKGLDNLYLKTGNEEIIYDFKKFIISLKDKENKNLSDEEFLNIYYPFIFAVNLINKTYLDKQDKHIFKEVIDFLLKKAILSSKYEKTLILSSSDNSNYTIVSYSIFNDDGVSRIEFITTKIIKKDYGFMLIIGQNTSRYNSLPQDCLDDFGKEGADLTIYFNKITVANDNEDNKSEKLEEIIDEVLNESIEKLKQIKISEENYYFKYTELKEDEKIENFNKINSLFKDNDLDSKDFNPRIYQKLASIPGGTSLLESLINDYENNEYLKAKKNKSLYLHSHSEDDFFKDGKTSKEDERTSRRYNKKHYNPRSEFRIILEQEELEPLVLLAQLHNKFGTSSVREAINELEALVNGYIDDNLKLSNIILLSYYLEDKIKITNNINILKALGLKFEKYFFISTNDIFMFKEDRDFNSNLIEILCLETKKLEETIFFFNSIQLELINNNDFPFAKNDFNVYWSKYIPVVDPIVFHSYISSEINIIKPLFYPFIYATKYPEIKEFIQKNINKPSVITNLRILDFIIDLAKKNSFHNYLAFQESFDNHFPNLLNNNKEYYDFIQYYNHNLNDISLFDNKFTSIINILIKDNVIKNFNDIFIFFNLFKDNNNFLDNFDLNSYLKNQKPINLIELEIQEIITKIENKYKISLEDIKTDNILLSNYAYFYKKWNGFKNPEKFYNDFKNSNFKDFLNKYFLLFNNNYDSLFILLDEDNFSSKIKLLFDSYDTLYNNLLKINNILSNNTIVLKYPSSNDLEYYLKNIDNDYLDQLKTLINKVNIVLVEKSQRKNYKNNIKLAKAIIVAKTLEYKLNPLDALSIINNIQNNIIVDEETYLNELFLDSENKYNALLKVASKIIKNSKNLEGANKFLNTLSKIGIKVVTLYQIENIYKLIDNEYLELISQDISFMNKIHELNKNVYIPICSIGTLISLYNNKDVFSIYISFSKKQLIELIAEKLKNLSYIHRQIKDGFVSSDTSLISLNDLHYLDLISLDLMLDFLSDKNTQKLVAKSLLKDYYDKRTEYGGLMILDKNNLKIIFDYNDFNEISDNYEISDKHYIVSDNFTEKVRTSISSFHFHAVNNETDKEDRTKYAGPSGIGIFSGDMLTVRQNSINDVVYSFLGAKEDPNNKNIIKIHFNANWYGDNYTNQQEAKYKNVKKHTTTIKEFDLGIYEIDVSKEEYKAIIRNFDTLID